MKANSVVAGNPEIQDPPPYVPLAELMRPANMVEFAGQTHLLGANKPIRRMLDSGAVYSMIFWGPPGTGKTTLARLISAESDHQFVPLSAVTAGVKHIRDAADQAEFLRRSGQRLILFVDEVHRFNKAQQDALLPIVENGTVSFIGATTENPSFSINSALISRVHVHIFKRLGPTEIQDILNAGVQKLSESGHNRPIAPGILNSIGRACSGDARQALMWLESISYLNNQDNDDSLNQVVSELADSPVLNFDRGGDEFYGQISALHKSIRGSSPDAALYWLNRILGAGGDPDYVARRLVRIASEDIGNADPRSLELSIAGWQAWERLGSPEGELALAQVAVYLACAPKSNAVYLAYNSSLADAREYYSAPVPPHLMNAPTGLMKSIGAGAGYKYDHDEPAGYSIGQTFFPDQTGEKIYYSPRASGLEEKISEKLNTLRTRRYNYFSDGSKPNKKS